MSDFEILGAGGFQQPRTIGDGPAGPSSIEDGEGSGFATHLADALGEIAELDDEVKQKAEALARGESVPLHELMISMGKSEVAFNLMIEVRNRLVEAWQVLSRSS